MKKIEAYVPSESLREVREAMINAGAQGILILSGKGKGKGERPMVGGARGTGRRVAEYNTIDSITGVVDDTIVEKVVSAILQAASTGSKGDGKIFVSNVEEAIDIGSKQKGSSAL